MFLHKKRNVHGFLLLDKPKGISSNNALQKVKTIFHAKKAGYIGTLDPLATGILPICFGECTKFSHYLTESNKKYHVIAKLGEKTSTYDSDGIVLKKRPISFTSYQLDVTIKEFIGLINQKPPMYSAIKHNGIPLYKYARQGINLIRNLRKVLIYDIYSIYFKNDLLEFKVFCSKGTYIRTLVKDLGEKLGCGAHVIFLRRFEIASYSENQLIKLHDLNKLLINQNINNTNYFKKIDNLLMSIDSPISFLPKVYLDSEEIHSFKLGKKVNFYSKIKNTLVRVIEEKNNKFVGLGKINMEELLIPHRLVSSSIN